MALSSTPSGEYLDVKVFLYKYTPQFTFEKEQTESFSATNAQGQKETVEGTYQVTKYSIDLNASKYFSKFELTQYLESYQFKQALYGNVYDWSLSLQDAIIPFAQLAPSNTATVRKVVSFRGPTGVANETGVIRGPQCRQTNQGTIGGDLVDLMAEYEAESNWPTSFDTEVDTITQAYLARGTATVPFASNSQGDSNSILNAPGSNLSFNNPKLDGIRLGDLVQKYNYVSVFVYKSSVSPTQAKRAIFPSGSVLGANDSSRPFDPSNEVHLMLMGYKNEFNGFVTGKSFSRVPGQVDKVTITGHGSLRLFSDTTSLFNPALMARGVFDAATLNAITPSLQQEGNTESTQQYYSLYQNLFQGEDPIQILTSLLFMMYKITFNAPSSTQPKDAEYRGFYDLHQLVLQQTGDSTSALSLTAATTTNKAGNLVTIAPFLVALVMALRNYDYNLQKTLQQTTRPAGVTGSTNTSATPIVTGSPDNRFGVIDPKKLRDTNFAEEFGGPCVQISAVDKVFTPYFKMLKNGGGNFLSGLKTPHQIMADVTLTSLLEFYERPNGRIILRTPQYNQPARLTSTGAVDAVGNRVTSKEVPIVQASYSEDGTGMETQKRGSWSVDLSGPIGEGMIIPSYGNGKLMMQYGFREATAEANPVLASLALDKTAGFVGSPQRTRSSTDINGLVHKYLRFLVEFDNAGLRTGELALEGDPRLEVGKLFFDFTNSKVGYIVSVSKQLSVGKVYTTSISLKFVRDIDSLGSTFRQLPTLEELVTAGSTFVPGAASTPVVEWASVPMLSSTGATSAKQIFSNLGTGLGTSPFGNQ